MTTDMQAALQACVDVLLHDGVPTDPEHPKRIAQDAAEAALGGSDAMPKSELTTRILGAIHDVAELKPEDDETWESWYAAAFDLLGSKVGELLGARPDAQADERGATCMCSGLGPCERPGNASCRMARAAAPVHDERGAPTLWEAFEMGFDLRSAMLGHVLDGRDVGRLTTCDFWHPALHGMHVEANLHVGLTVGEAISRLKNEVRRRLDALVAAVPQAEAARAPLTAEQRKAIMPTAAEVIELFQRAVKELPASLATEVWQLTPLQAAWVVGMLIQKHAAAPAPDREQVGETCIAPACHQWDGTDRCTCQHYRALDTLKRVATALPVLRTMLATEGLGGVEVADEMLSDIRALLAEKADASPSRECGDRQLSDEQREALEYALYALRQMTSIQSDDAREVIGALLSKGE